MSTALTTALLNLTPKQTRLKQPKIMPDNRLSTHKMYDFVCELLRVLRLLRRVD